MTGGRVKVQPMRLPDRRCHASKIGAKFPAIKIFLVPAGAANPEQVELFGPVDAVPLLSSDATCAECGAVFVLPRRNGRPQLFCSEACRQTHAGSQRRAWSETAGETAPTVCAGCGAELPDRNVSAGRYRRYCGPLCRVRTRRRQRRGEEPHQQQQPDFWKGPDR